MTPKTGNPISTMLIVATAFAAAVFASQGFTDSQIDASDAIVVGAIAAANSLTFTLTVARTLKGGPLPASLALSRGNSPCLVSGLGAQHGLWFLQKTGPQWALLPSSAALHSQCGLPIPLASSPASVQSTMTPSTVNDAVAIELYAGLASYDNPSQLVPLATALLAVQGSTLAPGLLNRLHGSANPELRFIGVRALLGTSSGPSALTEIANNLGVVETLRVKNLIASAVCSELDSGTGAVSSLGIISTSHDSGIQRCAAMALGYSHTRAALPYLAALLDSTDPTSREAALRGLSRFVENLPPSDNKNMINGKGLVPTGPAPFSTTDTAKYSLSTTQLIRAPFTEIQYLQFWKSWWQANMAQLTSGN